MTVAIDTNVVVRLLTADEPSAHAKARALVASQEVYVSWTVLIETEWVLRVTRYGFRRARIREALEGFLGLDTVRVADPLAAAEVLRRYGRGTDLADAVHVLTSVDCDRFVTFDRAAVARFRADPGPIPVTLP
jgi:predicted nucleic acid-binding protein